MNRKPFTLCVMMLFLACKPRTDIGSEVKIEQSTDAGTVTGIAEYGFIEILWERLSVGELKDGWAGGDELELFVDFSVCVKKERSRCERISVGGTSSYNDFSAKIGTTAGNGENVVAPKKTYTIFFDKIEEAARTLNRKYPAKMNQFYIAAHLRERDAMRNDKLGDAPEWISKIDVGYIFEIEHKASGAKAEFVIVQKLDPQAERSQVKVDDYHERVPEKRPSSVTNSPASSSGSSTRPSFSTSTQVGPDGTIYNSTNTQFGTVTTDSSGNVYSTQQFGGSNFHMNLDTGEMTILSQ